MQPQNTKYNDKHIPIIHPSCFANEHINNLVSKMKNGDPFTVELRIKYIFCPKETHTANGSNTPLVQPHLNYRSNNVVEQHYNDHQANVLPFNTLATLSQMNLNQVAHPSPSFEENTPVVLSENDDVSNGLCFNSNDDNLSNITDIARDSKKICKATQSASEPLSNIQNRNTNKSRGKRRRRRLWRSDEDAIVISHATDLDCKWSQIAALLKGRTGKQVRDRFLNYLQPNILSSKWTHEEDEKLIELYRQHGKKWCKIASQMQGRSEAQVKNRFHSQVKFKLESIAKDQERGEELMKMADNHSDSSNCDLRSARDNHYRTHEYNFPHLQSFYDLQKIPNPYFDDQCKDASKYDQQQEFPDDPDRFFSFNNELAKS